jgi:hypothetical protein
MTLPTDDAPMAVPCSGCGAIIHAEADTGGGALIELRCTHCGRNDVYHVNSLSPLGGLLQRAGGKRTAR